MHVSIPSHGGDSFSVKYLLDLRLFSFLLFHFFSIVILYFYFGKGYSGLTDVLSRLTLGLLLALTSIEAWSSFLMSVRSVVHSLRFAQCF